LSKADERKTKRNMFFNAGKAKFANSSHEGLFMEAFVGDSWVSSRNRQSALLLSALMFNFVSVPRFLRLYRPML